jgi:outer membrane usher protein FimD/PapC
MGKVVSVNDDQVTVSDAQGNEHTFRVPASADVMSTGPCWAQYLA